MKTKANSSPRSGGWQDSRRRKENSHGTDRKLVNQGMRPCNRPRAWGGSEELAGPRETGAVSEKIIIFLDTKSRQYRFAPSNMVASSDAWLFQFKYNKTESSVSQSRWSHFKWAIVTLARCYHRSQSRIYPSPQKSLLDGSDLKCPHPLRHPSNALEWTPNLPPRLRRPLPGSQDLFLPL